jgi:ring-1,2-phenylacetyl-CoA epoxidase subunit PaaE
VSHSSHLVTRITSARVLPLTGASVAARWPLLITVWLVFPCREQRAPRIVAPIVLSSLNKLKNRLFGARDEAPASRSDKPLAQPAAAAARPMRIESLTRETDDAVTIGLVPLDGPPVSFVSGQFVNLLVELPEGPLWRAYSICTAPHAGELAVTVKRIEGGRASSYLNQHAKVGQVLQVRGPSGSFVLPAASSARHVLLVAGGSGITPMMSHTRHLLRHEPDSRVTLLYGNRSERDIIFHAALRELGTEYKERLVLRHVLAEAASELAHGHGILDRETALGELRKLGLEQAAPALCLVCGPAPMMSGVREALLALGVPAESILEERFTNSLATAGSETAQQIRVHLNGQDSSFEVPAGETILEASQRTRLSLDFSCATGDCGTCVMKLRSGSVEMPEQTCLTGDERAAGLILPCVSRPTSACALEPAT